MGDHSKAGINTMFNTGTVVGICSNIYGAGFPRQFIPSFSKGGAQGFKVNSLKEAIKTAEQVVSRRNKELSENDKRILSAIYEKTAQYRNF